MVGSSNPVNAGSVPCLTVSVASLLFKRLPMLVATHRYCPASSSCTFWIWRTPLGKTVILGTHKRYVSVKREGPCGKQPNLGAAAAAKGVSAGTCLFVVAMCFGWAPRWWWQEGWRWQRRRIVPLSPQSPPQAQDEIQTLRYLCGKK